jgi:phage terminase large subunit-like protein
MQITTIKKFRRLDKQTYITCVEFPQMMKFFSPILKEFVVMMHRKEIAHNNNKILNWNISPLEARTAFWRCTETTPSGWQLCRQSY